MSEEKIDPKFLDLLTEGLEKTLDGKSAVVFMTKLHSIDGEDKLEHSMVVAKGFKPEDLLISLESFKEHIADYIRNAKNDTAETLKKLEGVDTKTEDKSS